MRLYVLRHGKADKDSPTGLDRLLVPTGREQAQFIADAFRSAEPPATETPQRVISSNAARAQATAQIVADSLGIPVQHARALFPDQHLKQALRLVTELMRQPDQSPVLLVGHNPQLEDLLRALAGPAAPDRLRTGELTALDLEMKGNHPTARFIGSLRADRDD
jgi:phosphohistidine phosphatase